ncbi:hypothetical protein [Corallococcus exercitus]|uniref:Uncharacterized protein n=1 Tax=Corallococcus exercitus TaxID=2316736 RepID=A0A7Y4JSL1_9BACT|nr:hypothetical protein [Corallococcus exercitus]NOK09487.1 hypothetical protein [Corallococcus exercitus]
MGLPLPSVKDFALLWRFTELESAAAERLAAARARADLFDRLWPGLDPMHPASDRVLQQLLERQVDAAFEPRPLWELTDFLQRLPVRKRLTVDSEFASRVDAIRAYELARRFDRVPELTLQELPALLSASGKHWDEQGFEVIQRILSRIPNAEAQFVPQLLLSAVRRGPEEMVEVGLSTLKPEQRRRALEESLQHEALTADGAALAQRNSLLKLAAETASRLGDFGLLLFAYRLRGDPLGGLRAATQLILLLGERIEESLDPLLAEVTPAERLAWALEAAVPPALAWFAASAGCNAAHQESLSVEELVRLCNTAPNGARVLIEFATRASHPEPLMRALERAPDMARRLVLLSLEEGTRGTKDLIRIVAGVLPSEQLLSLELRQALTSTREPRRVQELLSKLGPIWMRAVCGASQPPKALATWLFVTGLRQWLQESSRAQLFSAVAVDERVHALAELSRVLKTWMELDGHHEVAWMFQLLDTLLRDVTANELNEASQNFPPLVRRLLPFTRDGYFASMVLEAVVRTRPTAGWRLVELTFPLVYGRVVREDASFLSTIASLFTGKDWDKAKHLRHWYFDIYIDSAWPGDSFLRGLAEDTGLFWRMVHRAAKSQRGLAFLQMLPSALRADPELIRFWRHPVEEALENPSRPVDFE